MTAARLTRGAMSLSSSSHFPLRPNSATVKPVAFPPGRDMRSTENWRGLAEKPGPGRGVDPAMWRDVAVSLSCAILHGPR